MRHAIEYFSHVAKRLTWAGALVTCFLAGCVSVPEIPMGRPTAVGGNGASGVAYIARAADDTSPPDSPASPLALPPLPEGEKAPTDPSAGATGAPSPQAGAPKTQIGASDQPNDIKPDIKLRGRINADTIFVGQSPQNLAILGPIPDATGFRRARLGAEGTVGEQVDWVAEFDFAGGAISFRDVYIGLDQLPLIRRVQFGHMLEPFSLEVGTSPNYFALVECSPIAALDPIRNWGLLMLSYTENERATLQVGAFRTGTNNSSGDDFSGQNDMAYDVRATVLPW
ncbi:MAG TPA: porin, partial [Gemmataceae bacterium]|nr:porin [Gemmataceae bacterium]